MALEVFFPFAHFDRDMRMLQRLADGMHRTYSCDASDTSSDRRTVKRTPSYNIARDDKDGSTVLDVEMPGVAKKHLDVSVHNGMLTVIGKRYKSDDERTPTASTEGVDAKKSNGAEASAPANGDSARDTESSSSTDARAVADRDDASVVYKLQLKVPHNFDQHALQAHYADGLLRVLISAPTESAPRNIAIA